MVFYKKRPKGLYAIKGKLKTRKIYGFDCETEGEYNRLTIGSIQGEYKGKPVSFLFKSTSEFMDIIRKNRNMFRSSYLVATNLEYDFNVLFENVDNHLKKCFKFIYQGGSMCYALCYLSYTMSDNNIYPMVPEGRKRDDFYKIYFIDSMNFFKMGVEDMGKMIGIEKIKYKPKLNKDSSWKKPLTKKDWEELTTYNLQDSLITYKVMDYLQKTINILGGEMKITASSTSLDLFLRKFIEYPIYQPSREVILYTYDFYFGGRTECLKRGKINTKNYGGNIFIWDINSTYPFAMLDDLPYPNGKEKISTSIDRHCIDNFEGICRCRIKTPKDIYFPIIPVKKDKLIFPVGEFDCNIDFMTLRESLKRGYKLLKVYDGIVYYDKKHPFKEYMKVLYAKRLEYKKSGNIIMSEVCKLLMNSFYGKLGFRFDNKKQYISTDEMIVKMKKLDKTSRDKIALETECNSFHTELYTDGIFQLKTDATSKIPKYVNPIFAVYITAKARMLLYKYIEPIQDDVLYMDTDSIFTKKILPESSELGGIKKDDICDEVVIWSPKCYKKDSLLKGTKYKIKGVSHADKIIFDKIMSGKTIEYKKFLKWKESIKRGKYGNQMVDAHKLVSLKDEKRVWERPFDMKGIINSRPIELKGDDKDEEKIKKSKTC